MRAIWKGTISFGLVNIPIALGIAAQRSDPRFRTLDRETSQPIKQ
jgi:DNA end-binding protein Ku